MTPPNALQRIAILDSHTAGEPTRLVLSGAPDLGSGPLHERQERLRREHDHLRSAVLAEPRGSDVLVGALLCPPVDPACAAGVLFFNNVGYLGMCGHGTIGLVASLAFLGRIGHGVHRIETSVGEVSATLHPDGRVTVRNVPSYRLHADVPVEIPGYGRVHGDIAWGGNWFFLVADHNRDLSLRHVPELTAYTSAIMSALEQQGITGQDGNRIDHIELFAPPGSPGADSTNFVLCPGGIYDRSPCGTGTSAKLACLHASGALQPGEIWRQRGILGTLFEGSFELDQSAGHKSIIPSITGTAYITAESTLLFDPADPFREGIRA